MVTGEGGVQYLVAAKLDANKKVSGEDFRLIPSKFVVAVTHSAAAV